MKITFFTLLLTLGLSLAINSIYSQNIYIPDPTFKNLLVQSSSINLNSDTEIQLSEANNYTGIINVTNGFTIADMTGLEEFTQITELHCAVNALTQLDVSNNPLLTVISCYGNSIDSLTIGSNTNLTELQLNANSLLYLDLSSCPNLTILSCSLNPLTTLNVANGNNINMTFLATSTPNLQCIQVDDPLYSYTNWTSVDSGVSFSLDCSGITTQFVVIPDANFKAYLIGNTSINTNADTEIQLSEANAYTGSINCPSLSIADLTGIEEFILLSELSCYDNQISTLDVSSNLNLMGLTCEYNNISNLDISNNLALAYINCGTNNITSLDVSNNTLLTFISCNSNQLTALDVQNNTLLTGLNCWGNQLDSLNLNNNIALTYLGCSNNPLSSLNLINNTALNELYCGNNLLTTLDVSNNTALTKLACRDDLLAILDVSNNTALLELTCDNILVTTIDLTQNTALTSVYCKNNINLSTLNISNGNNQNLFTFFANDNPSLTCIEVDDVILANAQSQWQIDTNASYSEDCNSSAGIADNINTIHFEVYPNPVTDVLSIMSTDYFTNYKLVNMLGEIIDENRLFNNEIDFSLINTGLYALVLTTIEGIKVTKPILVD